MTDPVRLTQTAFVGGEVTPELEARGELDKYGVALRTAFNVIIRRHGGASARPGTKFIGEVKDSADLARLLPFTFSTEQEYQLLLGDQHFRIIKDEAFVLETAKNITGITQANPGVLEVTGHGYSVNHPIYVVSVGGMTELNGRFFLVNSVPDANHITLRDRWGVVINTTALTAYTSGGTVSKVHEVALPYSDAQAQDVDYEQTADTMFLTHMSYAVRKLTRSGHTTWALTSAAFATAQAAPTSLNVVSTGSSSPGSKPLHYVMTAVNALTEEESVASNSDSVNNDLGISGNFNTITATAASGAGYYNIYKDRGGSGFYGYIGSAVAVAGTVTFIDDNISAEYAETPPAARDPIGSSNNYPGRICMHENRLWFGQTLNEPAGLWATRIGRFENMNISPRSPRATDALEYVFTPGVQAIETLASVKNTLCVFTREAETTLSAGGGSDFISPVSIRKQDHSEYGSDPLKPLKVGDVALFAQRHGSVIRTFGYSLQQDGFLANDLTLLAPHIFETYTLAGWAYQQKPHSLAWMYRSDGTLVSCTLQLDQNVFAFARHQLGGSFGTGDEATGYGVVVGIVSGKSVPTQGPLILLVKRTINGVTKIYAEALQAFNWGEVVSDFWGLDCALLYEGAAVGFVTGLDHLEGETVAALVGGRLVTDLTVTNGRIDLPSGVTGTKILVGYQPPHPRIEPLPVRQDVSAGSSAGRKKKVSAVVLKLFRSVGLKVGHDDESLCPIKGLPPTNYNSPLIAFTGTTQPISLLPKFQQDGTFIIEGTGGLPFHILGFYPDIITE